MISVLQGQGDEWAAQERKQRALHGVGSCTVLLREQFDEENKLYVSTPSEQ